MYLVSSLSKQDKNVYVEHNSLAVRTNLRRRGVQLDDYRCLFCSRAEEDGAHLFAKCKVLKEVWRKAGMGAIRFKLEQADTVFQTLDIIWDMPVRSRVQILTFWWNNRNKLREGELPITADVIVRCSVSQTDEYLQLFGKGKRNKEADQEKWCPPEEGFLKLNCDAAYMPGENHATWVVAVQKPSW
jgi:hypothetical protein